MSEGTTAAHRFAPDWLLVATVAPGAVAVLLLLVPPRTGTDTTLQQWAFLLGLLAWLCSLLAMIAGAVSWWRARMPKWWLALAVLVFVGLTWLLWVAIPKAMLS
jgi:hypothetical protein